MYYVTCEMHPESSLETNWILFLKYRSVAAMKYQAHIFLPHIIFLDKGHYVALSIIEALLPMIHTKYSRYTVTSRVDETSKCF